MITRQLFFNWKYLKASKYHVCVSDHEDFVFVDMFINPIDDSQVHVLIVDRQPGKLIEVTDYYVEYGFRYLSILEEYLKQRFEEEIPSKHSI